MKKVAVLGGGIFGSTAALLAARAGHSVHVFEQLGDLLQAASGINQYRLHRGYHYPRSSHTAESAQLAEASFREEYDDSVIDDGTHLYAIAKERSKVSASEFLAFCDAQGLVYECVDTDGLLNPEKIELVVQVPEARFDPNILRTIVREKLIAAGVEIHVNMRATASTLAEFDKVIVAAYAGTGSLIQELTGLVQEYQYEVCEKPVVTLPETFGQTDLVVMDGPFMCIDPIGKNSTYVLGNVVHAIHATNVGIAPVIPPELMPYLNQGVIKAPAVTNFKQFIESGSEFIPLLAQANHVGSLFTVRTVLPNLDATDARPTTVSAIDDTYIQIFSGKVGNCVLAARDAVALI